LALFATDADLLSVQLTLGTLVVNVEDAFLNRVAVVAGRLGDVAADAPSIGRRVSLVHMLAHQACSLSPPASAPSLPASPSPSSAASLPPTRLSLLPTAVSMREDARALGVDNSFMQLISSVCQPRVFLHRLEVRDILSSFRFFVK
jgi:hypothetical protein